MAHKYLKRWSTIAMALFLGLLSACGGGGGSGSGDQEPAAVEISGIWIVEETVDGNCGGKDYPYSGTLAYTVDQQGNSVTVLNNLEGVQMDGSISGYTLTFNGTVANGDGSLAIRFSGTCAQNGQSFTGSSNWTYTETGYTCSGTNQITATRASETQIDTNGDWEGRFASHESSTNGSFTASITDTDGVLSGTLSVPLLGLDSAQLTGSVEGNVFSFGDIDGVITFVGVVANDGSRGHGSYLYDDGSEDEGTWQVTKQ